MYHANLNLVVSQETKLMGGVYTRGSVSYSVVAMYTLTRHCGVMAVFYRLSLRYVVEDIQQFSPNVFGFQLTMGEQQWCIIGCYLDPDDTSTIESVIAALKERPQGSELLVAGDLNENLDQP